MPLTELIKKSNKYEIQSYKKHTDLKELKKTYVPFIGSPQKHSYNREIVILQIEPYNTNTSYYEFKTKDIFHVEELPNITNMDGETVTMVRIWVKKKSVALRYISLGIFGLLLLKVFILDTSKVESVYRIAAFLATGVTLVAVSYLYQYLRKKGFFDSVLSDTNNKI